MNRLLLDGREVQELDMPVKLEVYTKCPEKWVLIDLETGEQYTAYTNEGLRQWKKLKPEECVKVG
jgi:hypothetical protein